MTHGFMSTDLVAQKAIDHLAKGGFDTLTETEKTVATAWLFDAAVSNTGFAGYYAGRRGDLAPHAPTALRTIGATQLADLAAEANAIFGPGGPPKDRGARRTILKSLPDSARAQFDALDRRFYDSAEDIDSLLEAFLHRELPPSRR